MLPWIDGSVSTNTPYTVPQHWKGSIGLHPYGKTVVNRLAGVTWPLDCEVLSTGTRGVHNVATGAEVHIHLTSGELILSRSGHHLA